MFLFNAKTDNQFRLIDPFSLTRVKCNVKISVSDRAAKALSGLLTADRFGEFVRLCFLFLSSVTLCSKSAIYVFDSKGSINQILKY